MNPDDTHLPCITDQLLLREADEHFFEERPSDFEVASLLLRYFHLSVRSVPKSTSSLIKATGTAASVTTTIAKKSHHLSTYAKSIGNFLLSSWQRVSIHLETWSVPSAVLVTYAHLRGYGSPWQVSYLTPDSAQTRALCLVTETHVELVQLATEPEYILSTELISSCTVDETELMRLAGDLQTCMDTGSLKSASQMVVTSPLRQSTRWELSYSDPWPNWRCVTFRPANMKTDYSPIVAVGYSNGSIEVIDMQSIAGENVTNEQTRILISPPCPNIGGASSSSKDRSILNPIVCLAMPDRNHLIACHLGGYVNFWHLDWEAKRFPARLMTRLYPEQQVCHLATRSRPLIAANYNHQSQLLVLTSLCDSPSLTTQGLSQRLGLHCFRVSSDSPYLECMTNCTGLHHANVAGKQQHLWNALRSTKVTFSSWLQRTVRLMYPAYATETDGVAFIETHCNNGVYVAAALQCSGTCSVWSVPRLEPLFMVLGSGTVDLNDPMKPPLDLSRPFRLAWWNSSDTESTSNPTDPNAQLVVLRENGELNVLRLVANEVDRLRLDERQVRELNLSVRATFAHVDTGASSPVMDKLVLLDVKSSQDVLWNDHLYGVEPETECHLIRAVRLASTTPVGLYSHLIMKRCYAEAIELATRDNHDVELVYQQQWLDLSKQPSSLVDLDKLVDTTLERIRRRSAWVVTQCLTFMPDTATLSIPSTISGHGFLHSMRHLLQHGLSRTDRLSDRHLDERVQFQLRNRLFHLQCIEDILTVEFPLDQAKDSLHYEVDDLTATVNMFRQNAMLDIALALAQAQRFTALHCLINRLPVTVGQHRLAILSTLCETIDPMRYLDLLLRISIPIEEEAEFTSLSTRETEAVDRLYTSLSDFSGAELMIQSDTHVGDGADLIGYANQLATWLVKRARQIEARTGLVSHAFSLLEAGEVVLNDLLDNRLCSSKVGLKGLSQLSMLRVEMQYLSKIVYHSASKLDRRLPTRRASTDVTFQSGNSNNRPIALARFSLEHFLSLSLIDRVNTMIQVCVSQNSSSNSRTSANPAPPSSRNPTPTKSRLGTQAKANCPNEQVISLMEILVYVALHCSGKRLERAVSETLVRLAWHHGLDIHVQLARILVDSGGIEDMFANARASLSMQESQANIIVTDLCLLNGLVETVLHFRPLSSNPNSTRVHLQSPSQSPSPPPSLRSTTPMATMRNYLDAIGPLLTVLKSCLSAQDLSSESSTSLHHTVHVLAQCHIGMGELLELSQALETRLGCTVRLGLGTLGDLVRCANVAGALQKLLAHWIASIACYCPAVPVESQRDEGSRAGATAGSGNTGLPLRELVSFIQRLHSVLKKAFTDCPAQNWLLTDLHYTLFTAGDEQLFQVAEKLQPLKLTPAPETDDWARCLLYSLRTYVDASVPFGETASSPSDPNEQMARYCLRLTNRLAENSQWKDLFHVEECLLNASAFLATIPTNRQSHRSSAPLHLRPLWVCTRQAEVLRVKCLHTAFTSTLYAHLEGSLSGKRRGWSDLIRPETLAQVAKHFLLSPGLVSDCLLEATFEFTVNQSQASSKMLSTDVSRHTCEFLLTAVHQARSSAWLQIAHWAGFRSDQDAHFQSTEPLCATVATWTLLHLLFGINRPVARDKSDPKPPPNLGRYALAVEVFRCWLAQFALTYGPADQLIELHRLVATTWYRVESLLTRDTLGRQMVLPPTLRSLQVELLSILTDRVPRHTSVGFVERLTDLETIDQCIPQFYLPSNVSSVDLVSGDEAKTKTDLNVVSLQERTWWRLFLLQWIGDSLTVESLLQPREMDTTEVPVCFGDALLSFNYAKLEAKLRQPNSKQSLHLDENSPIFSPQRSIWKPEECALTEKSWTVHPRKVCFIDRLRLTLAAHTIYILKNDEAHIGDCFPPGSKLIDALIQSASSPANPSVPEHVTKTMNLWCWQAVRASLGAHLLNLTQLEPSLSNLELVQQVAKSHLSLAARLAIECGVPLREALHSQLYHLFEPKSTSPLPIESENRVKQVFHWLWQLSIPDRRLTVDWCASTLYSEIKSIQRLSLLFAQLDSTDLEEVDKILFGGWLTIKMHRQVLSLVLQSSSVNQPSNLFDEVTYADLMNLLLTTANTPMDRHPLRPLLKTMELVELLSQVVQLLQQNADSIASAGVIESGDLFALYGLNCLETHRKLRQFKSHEDGLSGLLKGIVTGGGDGGGSSQRLLGWLKALLFYPSGGLTYTVADRRWLLTGTEQFLRERGLQRDDSSALSTDQPTTTVAATEVKSYLDQLNRTVHSLGAVPFPKRLTNSAHCNKLEAGSTNELLDQTAPEPCGFYAAFLGLLDPGREEGGGMVVDLLFELIEAVCCDGETDEAALGKLEWFGENLPACMQVLGVEPQAQLDLLEKSLASLPIPSESLFTRILDQVAPPSTETVTEPSTSLTASDLYKFIQATIHERCPGRGGPDANQLMGSLLTNTTLRRIHGLELWHLFASTSDDQDQLTRRVYRHAVEFLCYNQQSAETEQAVYWKREEDEGQSIILDSFISPDLIESMTEKMEKAAHADLTACSTMADVLKILIELTQLLWTGQGSDDESRYQDLWFSWLNFGLRTGLLPNTTTTTTTTTNPSPQSRSDTTWSNLQHRLLGQWLQYGCPPPRALSLAALQFLQHSATHCHPSLSGVLLSLCLVQPDSNLTERALDTLNQLSSDDANLPAHLHPDVGPLLICQHGALWTQLVDPSHSSPQSASLFHRCLHAAERQLKELTPNQAQRFGKLTVRILHEKDMWIEASRVARHLQGFPSISVGLEQLVQFVAHLVRD